ncbi:MAG: patatin-like phospholipase family protein [Gemmatimonadaceae bacterium]
MHRFRLSRPVVTLSVVLLASACSINHRPPATIASLSNDAIALRTTERATVDTIIERLAQRAVKRGDRMLDILMLSGGGQMGAYGAGFLRGWQSRNDGSFPQFDLVTGISTGALQSAFALIGTKASIDTLAAIYRAAGDRIAPSIDWTFWLRKTGGLVNTKRYRKSIEEILDERMQRDLRAAFADGRQLAIATADYDLAIGHTWDVSRELDSTRAGRERVQRLLLAASAIPGVFPPVVIDSHVHGDGGIVGNLLPVLGLDEYRRLAKRLNELGVRDPVTVRVWGLMNIWTHAPLAVLNPSSRKQVSARGTLVLFYSHQPQQMRDIETLAIAVTHDVPGIRMQTHFTAIPQQLSLDPAAAKLFNSPFMLKLETLGYARGRGDKGWDSIVSPFERPQ